MGGFQTWSSVVAQTHNPSGIDMWQYIWNIVTEIHC